MMTHPVLVHAGADLLTACWLCGTLAHARGAAYALGRRNTWVFLQFASNPMNLALYVMRAVGYPDGCMAGFMSFQTLTVSEPCMLGRPPKAETSTCSSV